MSLQEFIKKNKEEIDRIILHHVSISKVKLNNNERRLWILNDYYLYRWAQSCGVRI